MYLIDKEEKVITIVFFFQAEDGIRDYKVTGVQTCALPISTRCSSAGASWLNSGTFWSTTTDDTRGLPPLPGLGWLRVGQAYVQAPLVSIQGAARALPPTSDASYISALPAVRLSVKDAKL